MQSVKMFGLADDETDVRDWRCLVMSSSTRAAACHGWRAPLRARVDTGLAAERCRGSHPSGSDAPAKIRGDGPGHGCVRLRRLLGARRGLSCFLATCIISPSAGTAARAAVQL